MESDYPDIFHTAEGEYDTEGRFGTNGGGAGGAPVGPNGVWTMTTIVPMVAPGPALLTGLCTPQEGDDGALTDFLYSPVAVTVETPYSLLISTSTSVTPGTIISIQPQGGGCPIPSEPQVGLFASSAPKSQVVSGTPNDVNSPGAPRNGWTATLTVPSGLDSGRYQLEVDCVYSRGSVVGSYPPIALVVG